MLIHDGGAVMRVLFLVLILCVAATTSAKANTILFNDRTAFNLAVANLSGNQTTSLTFDTFVPLTQIPGHIADLQATYDDVFRVAGDIEGAIYVYQVPGSIQLKSFTGFAAFTTVPVFAFGVDITPLAPDCSIFPACSSLPPLATFGITGLDGLVTLTQPQFFGFLFDAPTVVGISPFVVGIPPDAPVMVANSRILLDNVVINTPEPSSLLLLVGSLVGLFIFRSKLSAS